VLGNEDLALIDINYKRFGLLTDNEVVLVVTRPLKGRGGGKGTMKILPANWYYHSTFV
jgi:hypothetical protein